LKPLTLLTGAHHTQTYMRPRISPQTVFLLAGLGLGVGSLASPTPHGPRLSPNAMGLPSTPGQPSPPHRSADQRGAVPINPLPSEA